MSPFIDYHRLWEAVTQAPSHRSLYSLHGPDHWRRVERNGCILAARTGAKVHVVRLFALFHDSRRENEGRDPGHGKRGAEFAATFRGRLCEISDEDHELLRLACIWHTDADHHTDPTIGTCWDADRLDLGRVGVIPDAQFMSTAFGKEIAEHGVIHPWLHLAEPYLGDAS